MNAYTLPSRWVLFVGALLAFLVIGAAIAAACTIYYGTTTIENLTTGDGPYTVVADNQDGAAMDRCDGIGNGSVFEAQNGLDGDGNDDPNEDSHDIRVEIGPWEGDDKGGCEDNIGNMAGKGPVYVTTYWYGDAYDDNPNDDDDLITTDDDDGDGVYEDYDPNTYSDEKYGEESTERDWDCMGDGEGQSDVVTKKNGDDGDGIDVLTENDDPDKVGQFDHADGDVLKDGDAGTDGDGVNEVHITIDTMRDSDQYGSDMHAGAICVSDSGGGDSAPQIPLVVT